MQMNVKRNPVIAVGLAVMMAVLTVSCATPVPTEGDAEYTWITQHTYDKVFQASQEACARQRALVIASDEDKGTIRCKSMERTFEFHIKALKAVNTKPQTQIMFVPVEGELFVIGLDWSAMANRYFAEVQAVLAGVPPRAPGTTQPPPAGGGAPSQQPSWSPPRPLPSPSCTGHGIGC